MFAPINPISLPSLVNTSEELQATQPQSPRTEEIINFVAKELILDRSQVSLTTTLVMDDKDGDAWNRAFYPLDIGLFDVVEAIKEEFDYKISEEEIRGFKTVGDIVNYIKKRQA